MITREEYIELRKHNCISYELLLDYYLENAKVPIVNNVTDFKILWNQTGGEKVWNVNKVVQHYDTKYSVMYIFDKDNKVVKVV